MEEPKERPDGWKEDEIHTDGWKDQTSWIQDEDEWMRIYDNHPEGWKVQETQDTQPAKGWQKAPKNTAEEGKDHEGWKVAEDTKGWKEKLRRC